MKENVHILHESAMKLKGTFSFHGFCYPWMSWNQSKNMGGGGASLFHFNQLKIFLKQKRMEADFQELAVSTAEPVF